VQQLIAGQIAKVSRQSSGPRHLLIPQQTDVCCFCNHCSLAAWIPDSSPQEVCAFEQGLFGWIGAPASGLWADRQALIGQADSADVKKLEDKYVKASAGASHVVSVRPWQPLQTRHCAARPRRDRPLSYQVGSRSGRTAAALLA